jgi:hypothetical protein
LGKENEVLIKAKQMYDLKTSSEADLKELGDMIKFRYMEQFIIPTEMVVTARRPAQIPIMGRSYRTYVFDYQEKFEWGFENHSCWVIEDWAEGGSDGHTDYYLKGYVLVGSKERETFIKEISQEGHYGSWPEFQLTEEEA